MRNLLFLLFMAVGVLPATVLAGDAPVKEQIPEFNTLLMSVTFKLVGDDAFGTAFILAKPLPDDQTKGFHVIVTAAHVLEKMKGELATLELRKKDGQRFVKLPCQVRIRENGQAVWTKHPSEDVAVMFVTLPPEAAVIWLSTSLLATDKMLTDLDIHPGDMLSCLGFPYGAAANDAGFPILRSGFIASYPLLPALEVKTFYFDMHVFEGNSGGPVYFVGSGVRGTRQGGLTISPTQSVFVAGLVTDLISGGKQTKSEDEITIKLHNLGLAKVVHAAIIRQAIEMLPAKPK